MTILVNSTRSKKLNEWVARQNAAVNSSVDAIVEKTTGQAEIHSRTDADQLRKTAQLFVFNSMVMGERE